MTVCLLQTTVRLDSTLERDKVAINPVVQTTAGITDADSLATDWVTALASFTGLTTTAEIHCKVYDAQKPPPNYPIGEHIINENSFAVSSNPREIALCLSFYAGTNVKRRRGRLYLPYKLLNVGSTQDVRPSQIAIDKVMSLGPILEQLGGVDVDWSVYSRVENTARAVTNYWCDNEWDVMRSRGLRGTTRSEATTAEESIVTRQIA